MWLALPSALLMTGCATELRSFRLTDAALANNTVPFQGAPYNLTFTQFAITVNRTLTDCTPGPLAPIVKVTVTAAVKPTEVRDPAREYVIDFGALRAFLKTNDVNVEYHPNGALKTVNAKITDETGPALASVVAAAAKVALAGGAGFAAVAPLGGAEAMGLPQSDGANKLKACAPAVMKALKVLTEVQNAVQKQQLQLESATLRLQDFVAVTQGLRWLPRALMNERVDLFRSVHSARDLLRNASDELFRHAKVLAAPAEEFVWPEHGEQRASTKPVVDALPPKQLETWGLNPLSAAGKQLMADTKVWARINDTLTPAANRNLCTANACADDDVAGIKFRLPAPGTLQLSTTAPPGDPTAQSLLNKDFAFSQLGRVYTLGLKNWPFMKQSIAATFDEAGRPLSLGTTSEAVAPKLAKALDGAVDEVLKVRAARKPPTLAEELKADNDLLELQKKNADLRKALNPAAPSADDETLRGLQSQATLINAEVALLKAREALADAQIKLPKAEP